MKYGGTCGHGWPGRWPNYSPAELEALERLRQERERLEEVNRWALKHLSEQTADCAVTEYLGRWCDLGAMMRRAHERYKRAEEEAVAQLQYADDKAVVRDE
jgi:hypothetical protein